MIITPSTDEGIDGDGYNDQQDVTRLATIHNVGATVSKCTLDALLAFSIRQNLSLGSNHNNNHESSGERR